MSIISVSSVMDAWTRLCGAVAVHEAVEGLKLEELKLFVSELSRLSASQQQILTAYFLSLKGKVALDSRFACAVFLINFWFNKSPFMDAVFKIKRCDDQDVEDGLSLIEGQISNANKGKLRNLMDSLKKPDEKRRYIANILSRKKDINSFLTNVFYVLSRCELQEGAAYFFENILLERQEAMAMFAAQVAPSFKQIPFFLFEKMEKEDPERLQTIFLSFQKSIAHLNTDGEKIVFCRTLSSIESTVEIPLLVGLSLKLQEEFSSENFLDLLDKVKAENKNKNICFGGEEFYKKIRKRFV